VRIAKRKVSGKPKIAVRAMRSKCSPAKHKFASKLRRNLTAPEKLLWGYLKDKQLGVWVYSQSLAFGWVLDFWIPACGLCLEIDGPCHLTRKKYDANRDAVLRSKHIMTVRFPASLVMESPKLVVGMIQKKIKERTK
jgi:very-short-patch-repair endonuclease